MKAPCTHTVRDCSLNKKVIFWQKEDAGTHYTITLICRNHGSTGTQAVILNSSNLSFQMKCRNTQARRFCLFQELFHMHQSPGKAGCARSISTPWAPEQASHQQAAAPWALGSPAVPICLGGAIKPHTHFSSCHLPHLLPCVHQPLAHRNHTNSEIDLLESTQSISIDTHTISLQMAKMNLKHYATGITAVCVGFYKK